MQCDQPEAETRDPWRYIARAEDSLLARVVDDLECGAGRLVIVGEIELSTTLNNAFRAAARAGTPGYGNFASRPELPAGLRGPVRLTPYGEVEIKAAPRKATRTTLALRPQTVRLGRRATATVSVALAGRAAHGNVRVYVDGRIRATARPANGRAVVALPRLARGVHRVRAAYVGTTSVKPSSSVVRRLTVARRAN